eukprot:842742-Rhodomonas_salina.1
MVEAVEAHKRNTQTETTRTTTTPRTRTRTRTRSPKGARARDRVVDHGVAEGERHVVEHLARLQVLARVQLVLHRPEVHGLFHDGEVVCVWPRPAISSRASTQMLF